jgi:hypothetical protein
MSSDPQDGEALGDSTRRDSDGEPTSHQIQAKAAAGGSSSRLWLGSAERALTRPKVLALQFGAMLGIYGGIGLIVGKKVGSVDFCN